VSCNTPEVDLPGIPHGDTFQGGKFRFKQDDDSYVDFSSADAIELTVREWSSTGAVRLTRDLDEGISLEDSGTTIYLTAFDPDLGPGTYYQRLRAIWTGQPTMTLWAGTWTICEGEG
jgi:hypothetical protein